MINDRRDNFVIPTKGFKTLHFWNRDSQDKKEAISKGFDLVSCDLDVHGNVVKEKKVLILNDAAFAMAGSSSGGLAGTSPEYSTRSQC